MKILVACEESQAVTIELRKRGHEAYSCDVLPCSGGHPEWHIQEDVTPLLFRQWDMVIAFPPCTFLSYAANRVWNAPGRAEQRQAAFEFFMKCVNANAPKVAVENPVGYPLRAYRKPDQIIHPYYFGNPYTKRTCLWLKNLPALKPTKMLKKPSAIYISKGLHPKPIAWVESVKGKDRQKIRSKTFPGIAAAMAEQWTSPFTLYKQCCLDDYSFNQGIK